LPNQAARNKQFMVFQTVLRLQHLIRIDKSIGPMSTHIHLTLHPDVALCSIYILPPVRFNVLRENLGQYSAYFVFKMQGNFKDSRSEKSPVFCFVVDVAVTALVLEYLRETIHHSGTGIVKSSEVEM
jgi:hypothetical protein